MNFGPLDFATIVRAQQAFAEYEGKDISSAMQARDAAPELVAAARPLLAMCHGVDVTEMYAALDAIDVAIRRTEPRDKFCRDHLRAARELVEQRIAQDVARLWRETARIGEQERDEEKAKSGGVTSLQRKLAASLGIEVVEGQPTLTARSRALVDAKSNE